MDIFRLSINKRLSALTQLRQAECLPKSTALAALIAVASAAYFLILHRLFHTLWYHKLFVVVCTAIFSYSIQELYFEQLEKKVKQCLPKATRKLSHYYTHYKGNVISSLMETEDKCPTEVKAYIVKIRKALLSAKSGEEIAKLKSSFPFVWFRMLASIAYMAKEKGTGLEECSNQGSMIGKNLSKMTNILSFINVQQGYNDAELKYIQLFLYFAPFLFVLSADWVNAKILIEMNMQEVYQGIKAQNIKAYLFLSANISALFIHWMRKQQI
jgi:hypothetical protein